jgi:hypothetical protein
MITTSMMIIRNAQSGAAGNQTICATALTTTKNQVDPAPGGDVEDQRALTADDDDFVADPARPQSRSREPRISIVTRANATHPEYPPPAGG